MRQAATFFHQDTFGGQSWMMSVEVRSTSRMFFSVATAK